MINQFIRLLRVNQWVKNVFIIFPLIFAGLWGDSIRFAVVINALFAFCFVSSSIYIINDFIDLKRDQLHPKKKNRPLSAGTISVPIALGIAILLGLLGIFLGFCVSWNVGNLLLMYILIHQLYNVYAKKIVILDVFFIAFGFQIRILVGALAAAVVPSVWLQMCVFVLALFLGFNKRRAEINTLKEAAKEHRTALFDYNIYLLDQIIVIVSTLTIVFYGLYSISQEIVARVGGYYMVYSLAFVIFGVFRYLYLVQVKNSGDEPGENLMSDVPMLINGLLWLIYVALVVYVI